METAKRKRPNDGAEDEGEERKTLTPGSGPEGDRATRDEEVEEFFAILRRMREAKRWLAARNGGGAGRGGDRAWWRPAFEWEDFEVTNDVLRVATEEEERLRENAIPGGLDLNAEPEPEGIASHPGGSTAARES